MEKAVLLNDKGLTPETILSAREAVVAMGRELIERKLVAGSWGNISVKLADGVYAVTPSGRGYANQKPEDIVIINGETGEIYINPSIEEMEKYKEQQITEKKEKIKLEEYVNKSAQTKDGYQVEISCNIGKPADLDEVLNVGADGIGLFRTEFLFMDSKQMPDSVK